MKKITFIAILFLISASCVGPQYNYTHRLNVGNKSLMVEIAKTPAAMEKGLSDRNSMNNNQGMLFDFGTDATPSFWMKDMKFGLDLIWIKDKKIIGITADVPFPKVDDKNLPTYSPPAPVDEVLEVNAGWAGKNDVKVGDEVKITD